MRAAAAAAGLCPTLTTALAADPEAQVRAAAAASPLRVLERLVGDSDDSVRAAAAKNPAATTDMLRTLADTGGTACSGRSLLIPTPKRGSFSDLGHRFCVHRETCDDDCRWGSEDFTEIVFAAVTNPSRPVSLTDSLEAHFDDDDDEVGRLGVGRRRDRPEASGDRAQTARP